MKHFSKSYYEMNRTQEKVFYILDSLNTEIEEIKSPNRIKSHVETMSRFLHGMKSQSPIGLIKIGL